MTDIHKISDIEIPERFFNRLLTGDEPLDEIFGGKDNPGIVPGAVILNSAPRGCGKSTFWQQYCEKITLQGYKALFASGEETLHQLKFACQRLGVENVDVTTQVKLEQLLGYMEVYDILVIDSFQHLILEAETIKEARKREKFMIDSLINKADQTGCVLVIISQQTKDGKERVSNYVPHAVQVVMYVKTDPDKGKDHRTINVDKNRHGPCGDHLALFTKTGYWFLGSAEDAVETPMDEEENSGKVPYRERNSHRREAILAMKEPPHITMERVMELFDIHKQTAYNLLRGLEDEGKIKKYGRGKNAIWKLSLQIIEQILK